MELSQESAKLFESAGEPNTLHIWRIQNFKPVIVPKQNYGSFYSGDSYLVLHSQKFTHHCHFWIGNQSTTDEYASAAFLTTSLSDYLSSKTGKHTVHHREEQQYESPLFASYFPQSGIQYLKGGFASGFKKVQPETFEPRLLHVKGVRPVRAFEVQMSGDSVNDGDAFIADNGPRIVLWYGSKVNMREKAEAIKIMNNLVSSRGKSKCSFGIANENEAIDKEFWTMLGGKPGKIKEAISDDNVDEDFVQYKFYRMIHDGDKLNIEEIKQRPLRAEMLESQDCFFLELPRQLFWWTGKSSELYEKKAARQYINQLVKQKHKSVTRVLQGMEDGIFRSYFNGFNQPTKIDFTKDAEERKKVEIDYESVWKEKQKKSVPLFKKQDITELTVHRVDNQGSLHIVQNSQYGYFFEDDCIIIDILCEKIKEHYIIFWVGKESSNAKRTSTAFHVAQMDNTAKIDATQARVFQGDEIEQLTGLFDAGFVLVQGEARSVENVKADKIMFHIKGSFSNFPKAAQVPLNCQNLNSGDSFVIFNQGNAYLWFGQGSNQDEKNFARKLAQGFDKIEEIEEGQEPQTFFELLGGKKEYCHVLSIDYWTHQPRLFQMSNQSGNLRIDQIPNFHQNDLFEEEIFLLDTYDTLFVWVGRGSNVDEKKAAFQNSKKFLDARQDQRSHEIPIMMVVQSKEPQKFKANFFDWDDSFVANAYQQYTKGSGASKLQEAKKAAQQVKEELKRIDAGSEFLDPNTNKLSYEQLKGKPKGINPQMKEHYLSDQQFVKVFQQTKAEFAKLALWKQQELKKKHKLF